MNIAGHDIAVCSWSLGAKDTPDLIARMKEVGLSHLQLHVAPLAKLDARGRADEMRLLKESGITLTAGMIGFPGDDYSSIAAIKRTGGYVPDDRWEARKELTQQAATITAELGIKLLSTHVGFIPPSSAAKYSTMVERVGEIAAELAKLDITLLMETGQETAPELLQFLNDIPARNVKINFDPANMILYGAGDPVDAVGILGRHVAHVHIKDAVMSAKPGVDWGSEVPFGTGQVKPRAFLNALHAVGFRGVLAIEREAGETRMADIRTAIETIQKNAG